MALAIGSADGSANGPVIRPGIPHARALAGLVLVVLLTHLALLGGVDRPDVPSPQPAPSAVQVRSIAPPPPMPPAAALARTTTAVLSAKREPRTPPARRAPAEPAMRPEAAGRSEPADQLTPAAITAPPGAAETAMVPAPEAQASAPASIAALDSPVATSIAGAAPARGAEWPVYATRMPPSMTLRYQLTRGALSGSGELHWQLDGARYWLRLDGAVLGVNVLTQISEGAIDAAGVAPLRFTDQRGRRSPQAANFQRDAGKVTFSGPSLELPLVPGAQDRLSWMIQLAAVVDADPLRWLDASQPITLQVVGARGDAAAWVFHSVGTASLQLPEGHVQTLHFRRDPRGPYETTVDVWLDPQRHHLPVRALQRSAGEGDAFELRLREAIPGP